MFLYCCSLVIIFLNSVNAFILFPETFVLQLTCCVAVPSTLPNRNFAINLCMQSNFMAPSNVSQLTPTVVQARAIQKYDDFDRKVLYSYITSILNEYIIAGEECLKRMICEAASSTIITTHRNSLLEKILIHVITPSRDMSSLNDTSMRLYHDAEAKGKSNENCALEYENCQFSLLDFLTTKFMYN